MSLVITTPVSRSTAYSGLYIAEMGSAIFHLRDLRLGIGLAHLILVGPWVPGPGEEIIGRRRLDAALCGLGVAAGLFAS